MEFKARIAQGEALHGVIVTMNPSVSEVLSECGFDWLWIDMEHAVPKNVFILRFAL